MTINEHQAMGMNRSMPGSESSAARKLVRKMALHDWVTLAAPTFLMGAVLLGAPGPEREASITRLAGLIVFGILGISLVRGEVLKPGPLTTLLYRFTLFGVTLLTYFSLNGILPVANTGALDRELYELDLLLFGFEPAMYVDQFVSPPLTEWFSFFYFGYFPLLAMHVIPMLLVWDDPRPAAELGFGLLFCFGVAHCVYVLVPGFGPWRAMPEAFQNDLPPGLWYNVTMDTVLAGSAMKDIFPSLHTAAPTFMTLYSFRHRDKMPFKLTWIATGFFALNIIGATMYMRWHYVIDVVAGLGLALVAVVSSALVVSYETRRRSRTGLPPLWPRVLPRKTPDENDVAEREALVA